MNMTNQTPVTIPVDKLHPFEGHPYQVKDGEEMNDLIRSVQEHGVLSPLIVRPLEGTTNEYEVISGHRRLRAAEKAGMSEVPAFIYALDRDAAAIAVVDSNLHREHILPSEKAFAYKLKYEALRHQGTSSQLGTKLRTDERMAAESEDSRNQIQRYIRLTNLIPKILEYVDSGRMALTPAVELSYLTQQEQHDLLETIRSEDCTPSLSEAQQMKKLSQEGKLDVDTIFKLLTTPKANQKEKLILPMDDLCKYFPKDATVRQMQETILKLIKADYERQRRAPSRDAR